MAQAENINIAAYTRQNMFDIDLTIVTCKFMIQFLVIDNDIDCVPPIWKGSRLFLRILFYL